MESAGIRNPCFMLWQEDFNTEPPGNPEDPSLLSCFENSSCCKFFPDGWPGFKSQSSHSTKLRELGHVNYLSVPLVFHMG